MWVIYKDGIFGLGKKNRVFILFNYLCMIFGWEKMKDGIFCIVNK